MLTTYRFTTGIYAPTGALIRAVKNLGWLRQHWKDVVSFEMRDDHVLMAHLRDGNIYAIKWADPTVAREWLSRPVFCGVPVKWFGVDTKAGEIAWRADYERAGGKPRATKVAPWMPGYEEYTERQRAAKAKAKATRESKKAAAQAARDAEQREDFAATLRSEQRIAAMGQGHSSSFMPPGGYRAVPVPDSMLRLFPDGRWFGIFPPGEVVGPYRSRTELERAAEQHAFDRGQGRGPHGETEIVGGQWVKGGKRRKRSGAAGLIAAAKALKQAWR